MNGKKNLVNKTAKLSFAGGKGERLFVGFQSRFVSVALNGQKSVCGRMLVCGE